MVLWAVSAILSQWHAQTSPGSILNRANASNFQDSHIWKQLSTSCATYDIPGTRLSPKHEDFAASTNCGVGGCQLGRCYWYPSVSHRLHLDDERWSDFLEKLLSWFCFSFYFRSRIRRSKPGISRSSLSPRDTAQFWIHPNHTYWHFWEQLCVLRYEQKPCASKILSTHCNLACIAMSENPVRRKFSPHIDIRRYFVRKLVFKLIPLRTHKMVADAFTKSFPFSAFISHRKVMLE